MERMQVDSDSGSAGKLDYLTVMAGQLPWVGGAVRGNNLWDRRYR